LRHSADARCLAQNLELAEVEAVVAQIEAEKEVEAERRRTRLAATAGAQASLGATSGST
jgi:20S proteasome subunit alpha 4